VVTLVDCWKLSGKREIFLFAAGDALRPGDVPVQSDRQTESRNEVVQKQSEATSDT